MDIIRRNKSKRYLLIWFSLMLLMAPWLSSCLVEQEKKTIFLLKNQSGKDVTVRIFYVKPLEQKTFNLLKSQEIDDSANENVRYLLRLSGPPKSSIDSVQVRFEDGVTVGFKEFDKDNVQPYNILSFGQYWHEHLRAAVYRYTYTFNPEMYYYYKKHGYYTEE